MWIRQAPDLLPSLSLGNRVTALRLLYLEKLCLVFEVELRSLKALRQVGGRIGAVMIGEWQLWCLVVCGCVVA